MSRLSTMVHQLCRMKGMKMKELAEAIGRSPATISQNLAKDKPRRKTFDNLAKVFGVEAQALEELYNNPEGYELNMIDGKIEIVPIGANHIISIHCENDAIVSKMVETDGSVGPKSHRPKKEKIYSVIDEETGEIVNLSEDDLITAEFNYKGTKLYAYSAQDIKTVANIIASLGTIADKEQHDATLSLLVKQYGHRW